VAVNAGKVTVTAEVDLQNIDGAASEIVARHLEFLSKRLHEAFTKTGTCCLQKSAGPPL
jgi:hypothetical protein